jgi:hypothetical protein
MVQHAGKSVRVALRILRLHVGSPAVNRDDDSTLAQDRHSVPHGGVGDSVLFGEASFAGKLGRDLALGDPTLDVVRNLNIGIFRTKGINRTSSHAVTIRCSLSCCNVS